MSICTLTKQAAEQINRICEENSVYAVSLDLKGGGCAGFEYAWDSINKANDIDNNDYVVDTGKGHFVIGEASIRFMLGSEIDFVKSMTGSKFEISNPNAQAACGCGVSMDFSTTNLSYSVDNGGK